MRVGLAGSRASTDLKILKREIEDRGHTATIFNPRKFPQYALSSLSSMGSPGASGAPGTLGATHDHLDLLGLDALYIGDLEGRDRFFRGYFDRDIWAALRKRYLDFACSEVDSLAFQMSLMLALAGGVPTVNGPAAIVATRLRPHTIWKIARAGIPVWPFEIGARGESIENAGGPCVRRIRAAEEACYDVPCFPRELKHTLSLVGEAPTAIVRTIAVGGWNRMVEQGPPVGRGGGRRGDFRAAGAVLVEERGHRTAAPPPPGVNETARRLLELFGLAVAEVDFAPMDGGFRVIGISAFPRLAEFEETTGERVGAMVAEVLMTAGGGD